MHEIAFFVLIGAAIVIFGANLISQSSTSSPVADAVIGPINSIFGSMGTFIVPLVLIAIAFIFLHHRRA